MEKVDSLSVGMGDLILCCRWETCGDPLSVLSYCERPNTPICLVLQSLNKSCQMSKTGNLLIYKQVWVSG